MAKLRRRIGAALQSFGEGLGTSLQQRRELELEQDKLEALTGRTQAEQALAARIGDAQIDQAMADAAYARARALDIENKQRLLETLLPSVFSLDGSSPPEVLESLDTTGVPEYGPDGTAKFPVAEMTRQSLGPLQLEQVQPSTYSPMDKFLDIFQRMPGSDQPGTLAHDLSQRRDDELRSLQTDIPQTLGRGLGRDWRPYVPVNSEQDGALTPDQQQRLALDLYGLNPTGILGGPFDSPEARAERASTIHQTMAPERIAEQIAGQAGRELSGDVPILQYNAMDPATGASVIKTMPRSFFNRSFLGTASGGPRVERAPLATGQQTRMAEIYPMFDAMNTLEQLVPIFQQRIDQGESVVPGPASGRLGSLRQMLPGDLLGLDDPMFANLTTSLNILLNNTVRAITGAQMSNPEAERIKGQVPQVSDRWGVFLEKLAATRRNLEAMARSTSMNVDFDTYYDITREERPSDITISGLGEDGQRFTVERLDR